MYKGANDVHRYVSSQYRVISRSRAGEFAARFRWQERRKSQKQTARRPESQKSIEVRASSACPPRNQPAALNSGINRKFCKRRFLELTARFAHCPPLGTTFHQAEDGLLRADYRSNFALPNRRNRRPRTGNHRLFWRQRCDDLLQNLCPVRRSHHLFRRAGSSPVSA